MLNWSGGLEEFACLLGNTYGELTVLEVMDSFNGSKIIRKGLFLCSCGKEIVAPLKNVLYGGKLSCGHLVGSKKRLLSPNWTNLQRADHSKNL